MPSGSRAKSSSRGRKSGANRGFRCPSTVSLPALLTGGTDHDFRALLYDLDYFTRLLGAARTHLAAAMGLTPPQYNIVMIVAEFMSERGISVGEVAQHLHVSGSFVTTEANKIVDLALIEKAPNPDDGRGILLRLTSRGQAEVGRVSGHICEFNDRFFAALSKTDFGRLQRMVASLIRDGEGTLNDLAPARPLTRSAIMGRLGRRPGG